MRVLSADFYVRYGGGMLIADAVLGRLLIYARALSPSVYYGSSVHSLRTVLVLLSAR